VILPVITIYCKAHCLLLVVTTLRTIKNSLKQYFADIHFETVDKYFDFGNGDLRNRCIWNLNKLKSMHLTKL